MRVAVASEGGSVSAHFGRCEEFVLAEVGDGSYTVVERLPNPGHDPSGTLPKLLKQKGVELVVTGGIGERAKGWLSQLGISVIEGVRGSVEEALSLLSEGRLEGGEGLCDHSCKEGGSAKMKVAVTSTGPDLDSQVDPRFGRCAYFVIVDTDTMEFEAVPNPNVNAPSGAGVQSAQLVAQKGAEVVITGAVGPNAMMALQQAGVQVVTGASGTVREAVEAFKSGALQPGAALGFGPGMGWGFGPGMGRGMCRGRGRGMGAGPAMGPGGPGGPMGWPQMGPPQAPPQGAGQQGQQAPGPGWGAMWPPMMFPPWTAAMFGPAFPAGPQPGFGPPPTDEGMRKQMVEWLRQQAEWLRQQLKQIEAMISELEDEGEK